MKKLLLICGLVLPFAASASENVKTEIDMPDMMLMLLLSVVILLAGLIYFLGKTLMQLSGKDYATFKKLTEKSKNVGGIFLLLLIPELTFAANEQGTPFDNINWSYLALGCAIVFELLLIAGLIFSLNKIISAIRNEPQAEELPPVPGILDKLYDFLAGLKPMEQEANLLMKDHKYDDIYELDNGMPPWLKLLFYATILFAIVYMGYFHIYSDGRIMHNEYSTEVQEANLVKEQRLALSKNKVDETNVIALVDASSINAGKALYNQFCFPCHGKQGEGGVGPNLTDAYWIHGGAVTDIFKTIKYGVAEKGMIAWKDQLKPIEMQTLTSYILTLQGTKPANSKQPEGELYVPKTELQPDSTKSDSLTIKTASLN